MATITLLAAVARNGVIGDGETMPWHLPEDLRHFRETTLDHPVVMGRRTFDSIGRPLPRRRNIVVTRDRGWAHEGVEAVHSVPEALALAAEGTDEVFVIGGGEVYRQSLPVADRLNLTEVDLAPHGSVTFPDLAAEDWVEVSRRPGTGLAFVVLERARRHSSREASRFI